jgi:competence protein ComEC
VFVVCDVGQGDGLVLRVGAGQAMVVDAGPDPVPMRHCLDELGVRQVPVLMFTHFHSDHITGMPAVFEGRRVGEVWVDPFASPPAGADQVRAEAARREVPVRVPPVGETGQLGDVSWQVLGPVAEHRSVAGEAQSAEENDASLVLMVTVAGLRILLTGDVEPPGQQAIVASGADLRADVLKIPHHGSAQQDPGFIAASHARVAIASEGKDNDYGHPAPRTVRLVQSLGMTFLRTDLDGSVAIVSDGARMRVVTQHAH